MKFIKLNIQGLLDAIFNTQKSTLSTNELQVNQ